MFDIQAKIHDRYTLELKVGYGADIPSAHGTDEMALDAWFFFPDALYLNESTYTKASVYRDVRTMVRLITPIFPLAEIPDATRLPLKRLEKWCRLMAEAQTPRHERMYEHQIKMFCSIVKSAIRDSKAPIKELIPQMDAVLKAYRALPVRTGLDNIPQAQRDVFRLGDEYLSRVTCTHLLERLSRAHDEEHTAMERWLQQELTYEREQGFILPHEGDGMRNRQFVHRAGQLKKYVESDLYILIHERSNTFYLQQVFFMLVAGLSMVFATVISFSFQQSFGNFTIELFIALTISYMFKDRIKSLGQQWFATKAGSKFFDYKTKLALRGERIGWRKTGTNFVSQNKIPKEIKHIRGKVSTLEAGHSAVTESVLIYRQRLALFGEKLATLSHYPLPGVNEIIRINLREFLRRMDSSHVPVYEYTREGQFKTLQAEKIYLVHIIIRASYEGQTTYHRFRISLTRKGIVDVETENFIKP